MKVHWLTQKWQQVPNSHDWLNTKEQAYFKRFKFVKKQQDWLLGRWTSKQAVLQFYERSDREVLIRDLAILPADDGAPEVYFQGIPMDCFISLSHSHGKGLSVVTSSKYRLGCDLEKIEPRSPQFITDYFTDEEQDIIDKSDDDFTPMLANLIWSAKESVVKALRTGLSVDTRKVQINCFPVVDQGVWNEFKIFHADLGFDLFGYWQWADGFVMTIVGDHKDFTVCEIKM